MTRVRGDTTPQDLADLVEMLWKRDSRAFSRADWNEVADDFDPEAFCGYEQSGSNSTITVAYPTLDSYRTEWVEGACWLSEGAEPAELEAQVLRASWIAEVEVRGRWGIVRKEFDGEVGQGDRRRAFRGTTYYHTRKDADRWRITGFTAIVPAKPVREAAAAPAIAIDADLAAAGHFSPVVRVPAGELVVLSGQGPLDSEGTVVGTTIEEQTQVVVDRCRRLLAHAGLGLEDVFKVNVYLADADHWERFNAAYAALMPCNPPARTTVGATLVKQMLIEVDMWACRRPA